MTDAEATAVRDALHAKLDWFLDEAAAVDRRSGKAIQRWAAGLTELLDAGGRASRARKHGTASFEAALTAGLPAPEKPMRAGFVASVK